MGFGVHRSGMWQPFGQFSMTLHDFPEPRPDSMTFQDLYVPWSSSAHLSSSFKLHRQTLLIQLIIIFTPPNHLNLAFLIAKLTG